MNNVDKMFEDIITNGYKYIEKLVEQKQEENLFLDFKRKSHPNEPYMHNVDRKNFAKMLSAFSNASGGMVIWGVDARALKPHSPDVAVGIKPIRHLRKFITDLNSLTHSAIVPVNNEVQNIPIYLNKKKDIGVAITYVPESDVYPHRALLGVNQYYTRVGDSSVIMEHHLLEDSFGKKHRPKLTVKVSTALTEKEQDYVHLYFNFALQNIGKYLSKYPALKIKNNNNHLKSKFKKHFQHYDNEHLNEVKISQSEYYYITNHNLIIHPSMTLPIARVRIRIKKDKLKQLFERNYVFSFGYEIYSQNCEPIISTVNIKSTTIQNRYKNFFK